MAYQFNQSDEKVDGSLPNGEHKELVQQQETKDLFKDAHSQILKKESDGVKKKYDDKTAGTRNVTFFQQEIPRSNFIKISTDELEKMFEELGPEGIDEMSRLQIKLIHGSTLHGLVKSISHKGYGSVKKVQLTVTETAGSKICITAAYMKSEESTDWNGVSTNAKVVTVIGAIGVVVFGLLRAFKS